MALINSPHRSGHAAPISSLSLESKVYLQDKVAINNEPLTAIALLNLSRQPLLLNLGLETEVVSATTTPLKTFSKSSVKKLSFEALKEATNHLLTLLTLFQEQADRFKQPIPIKKSYPKALETRAERLTLAYQHPFYQEIRASTWQEKYVLDAESESALESKSPPTSPIPAGDGFTSEYLKNLKIHIQSLIDEASLLQADWQPMSESTEHKQIQMDNEKTSESEWHESALQISCIIEQAKITLNSMEAIPELNMLLFYLQEFYHTMRTIRKSVDDRDCHAQKLPKAEAILQNISKIFAEDVKRAYLKADKTFKVLKAQVMDIPEKFKLLANHSAIGSLAEPTTLQRAKLLSFLDTEQTTLSSLWTQASGLYDQCLEELDMMRLALESFSKLHYPAFTVAYTVIRRDYWLVPTPSKLHLLHRLTNSFKAPYKI